MESNAATSKAVIKMGTWLLTSQILGVSRSPERHKEAWVGQSLHQSQQVSGMQDGIELLVCAKFLGLLSFAEFFSFLRCRRL